MIIELSEADYAKVKTTSQYFHNNTWKETEFYCRYCGVKPLIVEAGEGDYYVGPTYWCRSCGELYTMG